MHGKQGVGGAEQEKKATEKCSLEQYQRSQALLHCSGWISSDPFGIITSCDTISLSHGCSSKLQASGGISKAFTRAWLKEGVVSVCTIGKRIQLWAAGRGKMGCEDKQHLRLSRIQWEGKKLRERGYDFLLVDTDVSQFSGGEFADVTECPALVRPEGG